MSSPKVLMTTPKALIYPGPVQQTLKRVICRLDVQLWDVNVSLKWPMRHVVKCLINNSELNRLASASGMLDPFKILILSASVSLNVILSASSSAISASVSIKKSRCLGCL